MKKYSKFVVSALTLATLVGTSLPAMAKVEPRGLVDEQWGYEKVTNGDGNTETIETYSKVNIGTTFSLMSSYCKPWTRGAVSNESGKVEPGKVVRFRGYWSVNYDFSDPYKSAIYDTEHQY